MLKWAVQVFGLWGRSGGPSVAGPTLPVEVVRAKQGAALLALYEICYCNKDFLLRAFLVSHWVCDCTRALICS